jgi:hypothetical protein
LDAQAVDVYKIPLIRIPHLKVQQLAEDQLAGLLNRAVIVGAQAAIITVATELVSRESVSEDVDLETAFRHLIRAHAHSQQALVWIEKARTWSQQQGKSEAAWAMLELELSIDLKDSERMIQTLKEIHEQHLEVPGIREALSHVLESIGMQPPPLPQQPQMSATNLGNQPAGANHRVDQGPGIWTPGQPLPEGQPLSERNIEEQRGKSALWTP